MKARTAARLAWLMAVLTFATFLGTMALVASRPPQLPRGIEPVELLDLLEYVPFLAFAGLGVLIADRRPQNPIGWMFTAIGFLVLGADFATEYALYAFTRILGHFSGEHSWLG